MENKKDRAILVGLELLTSKYSMSDSLDELEHLAKALEIHTVDKVIQRAEKVSPRFYVGSGKVLEIKKMVEVLGATIVIFDDPLSPTQINNLEKELECQVIDRSFLILSIFSERAQSKQSILEVSLAQKEYMLPRLIGLGNSLSRQGGGSYNAKGPGETKLELDRRKLLKEISNIKKELVKISSENEVSRKKRKQNGIPIVALAGYTNVGKSSLMNSLSEKLNSVTEKVFEKDMLFATLDTKTKRMQKDNNPPFLLVDTVGFIKKLPHELIRSFESTLRDVIDADLLVIVADGAYFNDYQISSTLNVLNSIGASSIPKLYVLTKKEIAITEPLFNEDYIFVSNVTKENIDTLINTIYSNIYLDSRIANLKLSFNNSNVFSYLKENATILKTDYLEDGYLIKVVLSKTDQKKYEKYII
ncbi:GTPase HflX [Haploplasma axanthum]|uniref:GTPase HflX n=1 Tax=Haploplasma axanthum TaxID=29552 RepID=A0A449BBA5_HAPAX|nr:GTPase HflX [Haploplasma axanthum]VEU79637.1 GTP-binding protein HflX [Haploplasma axanthum]